MCSLTQSLTVALLSRNIETILAEKGEAVQWATDSTIELATEGTPTTPVLASPVQKLD